MATENPVISLKDWKMSLILDTYVDIFSSFDPRWYDERALSDDFLDECKKIVADTNNEVVELRLMVPEADREVHNEETIKKRLHSYFLHLAHIQEKLHRKEIRYSWAFVIVWILIGIWVSLIIHEDKFNYFYMTVITVIWEPASWLLIWTGADRLLRFFRWEHDTTYIFAHRLSRAKIQFYGY